MPINSLARAALYPSLQLSFQVSKVKTVSFQVKRKHKKSKSSKSKSSKKERQASGGLVTSANTQAGGGQQATSERLDTLRSAQPETVLQVGRLLMLQEGKFWPARLNSTKLPDVYGVVMDRQRGNRPIILPRDDILKEAVSRTHVNPYNFLVIPTEDKSFRVI